MMPDFPKLPIVTPPQKQEFPALTIVTPDPPRLSLQEKYGGLYYLGIAGLVFALLLVGSFAVGIWISRDLWSAIIVLHDPGRTEAERFQAAWTITRHPWANDRQRTDIALQKPLPPLARYIIAEGLTTEAIRADPKGYAVMVARSEGWPDWLRLLMLRPMAYGVGEGYRIVWEPLDRLRENPDPAIALWATYTRGVMLPGDPAMIRNLEQAGDAKTPFAPLARLLNEAAHAQGVARVEKLGEATAWLRSHHPEARQLWNGWTERNGQLVRDGNPD